MNTKIRRNPYDSRNNKTNQPTQTPKHVLNEIKLQNLLNRNETREDVVNQLKFLNENRSLIRGNNEPVANGGKYQNKIIHKRKYQNKTSKNKTKNKTHKKKGGKKRKQIKTKKHYNKTK